MDSSGLTIIMPVLNRAGIVTSTLDSIVRQSLRPFDLIVVDNGSTDGTPDVIARRLAMPDAHGIQFTLLQESQPGAAAARQRGLMAATTPVVMFFDSDDTMDSELARDVVEQFASNPCLGLLAWDISVPTPDGSTKLSRADIATPFYGNIVHGALSTQHYAARRELFVAAGGWNPTVRVWDDMELGQRLLLQRPVRQRLGGGVRVTVLPTPQSITRDSDKMPTGSPAKEYALRCMEQSAREAGRDDLLPWIDLRRLILAADYRRQGATTEARRLLRETLADKSQAQKLLYYLLYAKHLLVSRGTHLLMPYRRF